jgi:hypothetical protein
VHQKERTEVHKEPASEGQGIDHFEWEGWKKVSMKDVDTWIYETNRRGWLKLDWFEKIVEGAGLEVKDGQLEKVTEEQSLAEEKSPAEQSLAQKQRLAQERLRLAEEKEQEKLAEEQRLAEEQERLRLEKKQRLVEEQERFAEEQRLAKKQKLAEERRLAEEHERPEEEQRLAEHMLRVAEEHETPNTQQAKLNSYLVRFSTYPNTSTLTGNIRKGNITLTLRSPALARYIIPRLSGSA